MKKLISIFSLVLLLGTSTLVSAARGEYINFSCNIYSGVYAYSSYKPNSTNVAGVIISSGNISNITTQTVSFTGHVSAKVELSPGPTYGYKNFTNVYNYPGENVRASFIKSNINGAYSISGSYYYDGGF